MKKQTIDTTLKQEFEEKEKKRIQEDEKYEKERIKNLEAMTPEQRQQRRKEMNERMKKAIGV